MSCQTDLAELITKVGLIPTAKIKDPAVEAMTKIETLLAQLSVHNSIPSKSEPRVLPDKNDIIIKPFVYEGDTNEAFIGLANINSDPIKVGNATFRNVEAMYQWARARAAGNTNIMKQLLDLTKLKSDWVQDRSVYGIGKDIKPITKNPKALPVNTVITELAKKIEFTKQNEKDWNKIKKLKLTEAMEMYYAQNPAARAILASTENRKLSTVTAVIEKDMRDTYRKILEKIREGLDIESINKETNDKKTVVYKASKTPVVNNISEVTNHSGGANGADTLFDIIGNDYGMKKNNHYYFGKKTPKGNIRLTEAQVNEGTEMYKKSLYRTGKYETKDVAKRNLLSRNWYQVKNSTQIIAIAKLTKSKTGVEGGTGYAVAMAQEWNSENRDNQKEINVFDPYANKWYQWDGQKFQEGVIPKLQKDFAGIGSREIEDSTETSFTNKEGKLVTYNKYDQGTFNSEIGINATNAIIDVYTGKTSPVVKTEKSETKEVLKDGDPVKLFSQIDVGENKHITFNFNPENYANRKGPELPGEVGSDVKVKVVGHYKDNDMEYRTVEITVDGKTHTKQPSGTTLHITDYINKENGIKPFMTGKHATENPSLVKKASGTLSGTVSVAMGKYNSKFDKTIPIEDVQEEMNEAALDIDEDIMQDIKDCKDN